MGAELKLDSMKTLIGGGVAFADPEKNMGEPAKPGTHFPIQGDIKKEWEQWSPHISISPRLGHSTSKTKNKLNLF
jgi:paraquat-inducible protein B